MAEFHELAYHPYVAFIAHFDHAESIRLREKQRGPDPFVRRANRFSRDCEDIREELTKSYNAYRDRPVAAERPAAAGASESGLPQDGGNAFAPYLFRPLSYAALGKTDDLSLVLIDNLPLAIRLTSLNRSMESAEVAFCPRVATIRFDARVHRDLQKTGLVREARDAWPFWDLDRLLADVQSVGLDPGGLQWTDAAAMPTRLQGTPLCVVTNFTLNTLASLGHGALLTQATLEVMADTIRRTCLAFFHESSPGAKAPADENAQPERRAGGGTSGRRAAEFAAPAIEPVLRAEDFESLKCVLLEPQTAEDITLLSFCSNYSIANLLVTALRNLTIGDLLDWGSAAEPQTLEQQAEAPNPTRPGGSPSRMARILGDRRMGRLHVEIMRHAARSKDPNRKVSDDPNLTSIRGNHVFMTSYSTLCASHYALRDPQAAGVYGWVEAYINIDSNPGHEREIRNRLQATRVRRRWPPQTARPDADSIHRIMPGLHDEFENLAHKRRVNFQPGAMVPTQYVFDFLREFLSNEPNQAAGAETGFLDLSTSLVIPIPRIEANSANPQFAAIAARLPHGELLPEVDQDRHLHGMQMFLDVSWAVEKSQFGLGDARDLRGSLRNLGCPPSLQYSLINLIEEFLTCLKDSHRCMAVLDLYECFAALARLLGKDLPAYFELADKALVRRMKARLFEEGFFTEFIEALSNSFALRLQRSVSNHETRDRGLTFRVGAGKFLSAMDVSLKCSLGLYRRMFGVSGAMLTAPEFRQRFAAVAAIEIGQQTTCRFGYVGKRAVNNARLAEEFPTFLNTFKLDVMRPWGPEQIVHFLHEFAHLYFERFFASSAAAFGRDFVSPDDLPEAGGDLDPHEYIRMVTAEVFAELVTHIFVFGADTDSFSKCFALRIGEVHDTVVKATNPQPKSFQQGLADATIVAIYRAFLVVDSIGLLGSTAQQPVAEWPEEHPCYGQACTGQVVAAAWSRFQDFIRAYGPFFRDYSRLWPHGPAQMDWARFEKLFRTFYSAEKHFLRMRRVWQKAVEVHRKYCAYLRQPPEGDAADAGGQAEPHHDIELLGSRPRDPAAFDKTIEQCLRAGSPFHRIQPTEAPQSVICIDALFVVCKLAYHYIRIIYGGLSADRVTYLEEDNLHGSKDRFNRFLFHPGHFPLYCVEPQARRDRLLSQIACFKTLADISSQLRARRLLDMLDLLNATESNDHPS